VDGYLRTPKGIILFDYKTDHVNSRNLAQSEAKLIDRYGGQVNLYAEALQQMTQQPVIAQYLYLLTAGQLVAVPKQEIQR